MAGRDVYLTQAAARQSLAVPDALSFENLFDAARAPEKPARTVLTGYSGQPAKRAAGNVDCHLDVSSQLKACRKSSTAFISFGRAGRVLTARVVDQLRYRFMTLQIAPVNWEIIPTSSYAPGRAI